jgi:amino acid transporter
MFVMDGTKNYTKVIHKQHLTASAFSKAFISCFFFFLGFETYATIGKNIKNPQKNIGLSIIIVMIMTTLFYVFITAIMIGAIEGAFKDNPNLQIFEELGRRLHASTLIYIGVIIMLICTISLKANAGMQNSLYSGGMLEPLSVEGYISPKLGKLNSDNIPYRAVFLNLVVTFAFAFF